MREPRAELRAVNASLAAMFMFVRFRLPKQPCPNHDKVHCSIASGGQSVHARTIMTCMLERRTPMPKS